MSQEQFHVNKMPSTVADFQIASASRRAVPPKKRKRLFKFCSHNGIENPDVESTTAKERVYVAAHREDYTEETSFKEDVECYTRCPSSDTAPANLYAPAGKSSRSHISLTSSGNVSASLLLNEGDDSSHSSKSLEGVIHLPQDDPRKDSPDVWCRRKLLKKCRKKLPGTNRSKLRREFPDGMGENLKMSHVRRSAVLVTDISHHSQILEVTPLHQNVAPEKSTRLNCSEVSATDRDRPIPRNAFDRRSARNLKKHWSASAADGFESIHETPSERGSCAPSVFVSSETIVQSTSESSLPPSAFMNERNHLPKKKRNDLVRTVTGPHGITGSMESASQSDFATKSYLKPDAVHVDLAYSTHEEQKMPIVKADVTTREVNVALSIPNKGTMEGSALESEFTEVLTRQIPEFEKEQAETSDSAHQIKTTEAPKQKNTRKLCDAFVPVGSPAQPVIGGWYRGAEIQDRSCDQSKGYFSGPARTFWGSSRDHTASAVKESADEGTLVGTIAIVGDSVDLENKDQCKDTTDQCRERQHVTEKRDSDDPLNSTNQTCKNSTFGSATFSALAAKPVLEEFCGEARRDYSLTQSGSTRHSRMKFTRKKKKVLNAQSTINNSRCSESVKESYDEASGFEFPLETETSEVAQSGSGVVRNIIEPTEHKNLMDQESTCATSSIVSSSLGDQHSFSKLLPKQNKKKPAAKWATSSTAVEDHCKGALETKIDPGRQDQFQKPKLDTRGNGLSYEFLSGSESNENRMPLEVGRGRNELSVTRKAKSSKLSDSFGNAQSSLSIPDMSEKIEDLESKQLDDDGTKNHGNEGSLANVRSEISPSNNPAKEMSYRCGTIANSYVETERHGLNDKECGIAGQKSSENPQRIEKDVEPSTQRTPASAFSCTRLRRSETNTGKEKTNSKFENRDKHHFCGDAKPERCSETNKTEGKEKTISKSEFGDEQFCGDAKEKFFSETNANTGKDIANSKNDDGDKQISDRVRSKSFSKKITNRSKEKSNNKLDFGDNQLRGKRESCSETNANRSKEIANSKFENGDNHICDDVKPEGCLKTHTNTGKHKRNSKSESGDKELSSDAKPNSCSETKIIRGKEKSDVKSVIGEKQLHNEERPSLDHIVRSSAQDLPSSNPSSPASDDRSHPESDLDSDEEQQLWIQCDSCKKWRIIPCTMNGWLPDKWRCEENLWDPDRASCDVPQQELEDDEYHVSRQKLKEAPESSSLCKSSTNTGKDEDEPGMRKRPRGRPPVGKVWDSARGIYVPDDELNEGIAFKADPEQPTPSPRSLEKTNDSIEPLPVSDKTHCKNPSKKRKVDVEFPAAKAAKHRKADLNDSKAKNKKPEKKSMISKRDQKHLEKLLEIGRREARAELEREKAKIMSKLPPSIKSLFGQIGFAKWGRECLPALVLNPYMVPPGAVRDAWLKMFRRMRKNGHDLANICILVHWYGEQDPDNLFSLVEASKFMPYAEATSETRNYAKAAHQKVKLQKKLTRYDKQRLRAMEELRADLAKDPCDRKPLEFKERDDLLTLEDVKECLEEGDVSEDGAESLSSVEGLCGKGGQTEGYSFREDKDDDRDDTGKGRAEFFSKKGRLTSKKTKRKYNQMKGDQLTMKNIENDKIDSNGKVNKKKNGWPILNGEIGTCVGDSVSSETHANITLAKYFDTSKTETEKKCTETLEEQLSSAESSQHSAITTAKDSSLPVARKVERRICAKNDPHDGSSNRKQKESFQAPDNNRFLRVNESSVNSKETMGCRSKSLVSDAPDRLPSSEIVASNAGTSDGTDQMESTMKDTSFSSSFLKEYADLNLEETMGMAATDIRDLGGICVDDLVQTVFMNAKGRAEGSALIGTVMHVVNRLREQRDMALQKCAALSVERANLVATIEKGSNLAVSNLASCSSVMGTSNENNGSATAPKSSDVEKQARSKSARASTFVSSRTEERVVGADEHFDDGKSGAASQDSKI